MTAFLCVGFFSCSPTGVQACEGDYGVCMQLKYNKNCWHCVDSDGKFPDNPNQDQKYSDSGCFDKVTQCPTSEFLNLSPRSF